MEHAKTGHGRRCKVCGEYEKACTGVMPEAVHAVVMINGGVAEIYAAPGINVELYDFDGDDVEEQKATEAAANAAIKRLGGRHAR